MEDNPKPSPQYTAVPNQATYSQEATSSNDISKYAKRYRILKSECEERTLPHRHSAAASPVPPDAGIVISHIKMEDNPKLSPQYTAVPNQATYSQEATSSNDISKYAKRYRVLKSECEEITLHSTAHSPVQSQHTDESSCRIIEANVDEDLIVNILLQELNDECEEILTEICAEKSICGYLARNTHERNKHFYEETIPKYSLDDFKKHFRMSRSTFEILFTLVWPQLNPKGVVAPEKKLLLSIWLLAHPETFIAAGDRFGVSYSTAHYVFKETVQIICTYMSTFIKFPNREVQLQNSLEFENKSGIPGIVGAIDGCHIPIKQPPKNANDFYNRKNFHSIVLQGICDQNLKFIDVHIGKPGRMHDANVFKNSPIYEKLQRAENVLISINNHLIGDCAYPYWTFLLTPFKDNGHLSRAKLIFNTKLSINRQVIERCFGLLKENFAD